MTYPYRLMAPGPVPLAPEVKAALAEDMIHHRTPEFDQILSRVLQALPPIFETRQPVLLQTSTGSGAMESALVNCLSPGEEVLAIVSGKFGERWAKMAEVYQLQVHTLDVPWGEPVHLDRLIESLQQHSKVKAVLTQACETSTATLHPVKEIARLVRHHTPQALLMVDAITALGATPLYMDEWDLDVVIAGSQKAFMIPTGLAFVALSERAWQANKTARLPRFYFDLAKELETNRKGETLFSSAVALVKALDRVLWRFEGEKLRHQKNRCFAHAEVTREMAQNFLQMSVYSQAPSPSVTALNVPKNIDGQKLRQHLEKTYNVTVVGGQDQLKGKILRIGHLGFMSNEDIVQTLLLLGRSLVDLGLSLTDNHLREMTAAAEDRLKTVIP